MALSVESRETFITLVGQSPIKAQTLVYVVRCNRCMHKREYHEAHPGITAELRQDGWTVFDDTYRHYCPTCKPPVAAPSLN